MTPLALLFWFSLGSVHLTGAVKFENRPTAELEPQASPGLLAFSKTFSNKKAIEQFVQRLTSSAPEECDRCPEGEQWLFVLSSRSQPSAVVGALNAIPGHHVGTAASVVDTVKQLYDVGVDINSHNEEGKAPAAFKSRSIAEAKLVCGLRAFAKNMALADHVEAGKENVKVMGFQEPLPWKSRSIGNERRGDFMTQSAGGVIFDKIFPCARFIVEPEDHAGRVAQLVGTRVDAGKENDTANNTVASDAEAQASWRKNHTDSTFAFDNGDYSAPAFNKLLTWLNVEGCQYTEVAKPVSDHQDGMLRLGQLPARARLEGNCQAK